MTTEENHEISKGGWCHTEIRNERFPNMNLEPYLYTLVSQFNLAIERLSTRTLFAGHIIKFYECEARPQRSGNKNK